MRDDADKSGLQLIEFLKLLNGRLKRTGPVLNPPLQRAVQLVEFLFRTCALGHTDR